MKIALLSNTNLDFAIRFLSKENNVYKAEGYGNELGLLLNSSSSYYEFKPEITFLFIDIMELINHNLDLTLAKDKIKEWFECMSLCIRRTPIFYITDATIIGQEAALIPANISGQLTREWNERLTDLCENDDNVRILYFHNLLSRIGMEKVFSPKTWYMGKILLGMETQKLIVEEICHKVYLENRVPKKVLVVDLDNTLWGGLAGENDVTPIVLSDDHLGLIYKDVQRILKLIKNQGVLLAIASKNNEDDVMNIIDKHPHMILQSDDFVLKKINWNSKDISIREIANDLNLSTDSFVFWDDSPIERELVRHMMPEVIVPEFPENVEKMAQVLISTFHDYFEKNIVTREDLEKTKQYAANIDRKAQKDNAINFDDYLKKLQTKITRVSPQNHTNRLLQLINKTNQFNLTTLRLSISDIERYYADPKKRVYAYSVADRFGDSGIVAVLIVDVELNLMKAVIEEFVMSCRVMGRQVENAILEDVEQQLFEEGVKDLTGKYAPTKKNIPVRDFYSRLGYKQTEKENEYCIVLKKNLKRPYQAKLIK